MSVSPLRCFLCWAMMMIVPATLLGQTGQDQGLPGQTVPGQTASGQTGQGQAASAILHTQGGVWVNGYEARDSSAVFAGDLIETKPEFSATLSLEGTTILIQQETVGKLQGDMLVLDHGSVSVGTSKGFKVRVKCITVVPVLNEWTQYEVTDRNGTVQVAARKNDVNVEHEAGARKASPGMEAAQGPTRETVHEGEQKSYDEAGICGAPAPTGPSSSLNPKWIAAGAAGAGVLIWILVHGTGKTPISAAQP
jgi:hypothetical protein